jgi:hypothetical protein
MTTEQGGGLERMIARERGAVRNRSVSVNKLAQESQPTPKQTNDGLEEAFQVLNAASEQDFRATLDAGLDGKSALKRAQPLNKVVGMVDQERTFRKDPITRFGGQDLVSAYQEQKAAGGPNVLSAENFSTRMHTLRIMGSTFGREFIEDLQTFRDGLKGDERRMFDDEFFERAQDDIVATIARAESGPTMEAGPTPFYFTKKGKVTGTADGADEAHFFSSPEKERLMKKWQKHMGFEFGGQASQQILPDTLESRFAEYVEQQPELIRELQEMGVVPDLRTAGARREDTIAKWQDIATEKVKQAAADTVSEHLGTILATEGLEKLGVVESGEETREYVNAVTRAIIDEVASKEFVAITGVSLVIPVIGPTARMGIFTRTISNAIIGGLINVGYDVSKNRTDIDVLAQDFAIGAFATATLTEVIFAFTRVKTSNRAAMLEAIESMRAANGTSPKNIRVDPDLPTMQPQFGGQPPEITAAPSASLRVAEHRSALADDGVRVARNEVRRIQAEQSRHGLVDGSETLVADDGSTLGAARARQAEARTRAREAQDLVREEQARVEVKAATEKARGTAEKQGATPEEIVELEQLVAKQTGDTLEILNQYNDVLMGDGGLRRAAVDMASRVAGRAPASLGVIRDMANGLAKNINMVSKKALKPVTKEADELVKRMVKNNELTYVGPERFRRFSRSHTAELLAENPEWFQGVDPRFLALHKQIQGNQRAKLEMLRKMGYPIKALEGNYYPQMWEGSLDDAVRIGKMKGKIAPARDRTVPSYAEGLEAGLTPRAMTYGDRWLAHDALFNQAIGDSFERALVVARFGKKPAKLGSTFSSRNRRLRPFKSELYKGYQADHLVVDHVDRMHQVDSGTLRTFRSVAGKFKNTAFGTLDVAVFGVHMPFAVRYGGPGLIAGTIDDLLSKAGMGLLKLDEPIDLLAARYGVPQSSTAANLNMAEGTVLDILKVGNVKVGPVRPGAVADWVNNYTDWLARVQFDNMMAPIRNQIFKGNLLLLHLARQNIKNPATIRAAARKATTFSLSSFGAQTGSRKSLEHGLATAANAARAEWAVTAGALHDVIRLATLRPGSGPDGILSMIGVAWAGSLLYATSRAVHHALGIEPPEWNPLSERFWQELGTIPTGSGPDSHRISIMKERALTRAFYRSYQGLQESDPEQISRAWQQLFIGKASPLVGGQVSLWTGHGFSQTHEGVFRTGDLSAKERGINLVPFAPILTEILVRGERNKVALAFEGAGYNVWDLRRGEILNNYARANNPYDPDDPRYLDVREHGYYGLEREERYKLTQERPDLFVETGGWNREMDAIFERMEQNNDKLREIEAAVHDDPFMRRDYKDLRKQIVLDNAKLFENVDRERELNTLQEKAMDTYYATINNQRVRQLAEQFMGGEYGIAEELARDEVLAAHGEDGIKALDRGLAVGVTQLETEYRSSRQAVKQSGYYEIPNTVARNYGFEDFNEFMTAVQEHAAENKIEPEKVPAYSKVQSDIRKFKLEFRSRAPEVDAILSIWDGARPRTPEAQRIVEMALGRSIPLSEDAQRKLDKESRPSPQSKGFSLEELSQLIR